MKSRMLIPAIALLALMLSPSQLPAVIPPGAVAIYSFTGNANDSVGTNNGSVVNATLTSSRRKQSPNGSRAYSFNGTNAYIQLPDSNLFSISTAAPGGGPTGELSISFWMRPSTANFPTWESTGDQTKRYIHLISKGTANGQNGNQEWLFRLYFGNAADRPYRTSAYAFNRNGGLGNGAYIQNGAIPQDKWTHVVAVWKMTGTYPNGDYVTIYKRSEGGTRTEETAQLSTQPTNPDTVVPTNQNAPVRIGRGMASYFKGRLDDIIIYKRALTATQVEELYSDTTLW